MRGKGPASSHTTRRARQVCHSTPASACAPLGTAQLPSNSLTLVCMRAPVNALACMVPLERCASDCRWDAIVFCRSNDGLLVLEWVSGGKDCLTRYLIFHSRPLRPLLALKSARAQSARARVVVVEERRRAEREESNMRPRNDQSASICTALSRRSCDLGVRRADGDAAAAGGAKTGERRHFLTTYLPRQGNKTAH